jgi:hypothetical protein
VTEAWDDEALLEMLREALRSREAVPDEFLAAGRSAFTWRNIDSELASLTYDSTRAPDLLARTRSESASIRGLTFTSPRLTIELEVTADSILGQVIPPEVATIEVQTQADANAAVLSSDEIGCFVISPIPPAPFRLRCRNEAGIDVLTGWITL